MSHYIERYLKDAVIEDLKRKMVFVAGPRQSGKTTFAKHLLQRNVSLGSDRYLNWDIAIDRENIIRERFPSEIGLIVLDEIHKYSRWRQVIKGLYDGRGDKLQILVTGSAKLDHYRHGGDSLQGRYHFHRIHPLTLAELESQSNSDLESLFMYGGFPEPFLMASERQTRRWSADYRTRLIQDDLNTLETVKDVTLLESLAIRLPDMVGSPLSINSLSKDLQVAHQTVSRWIQILENIYMIFRVYPFGAPKIRAVKKEAKHYHFDWTLIKKPGFRFENLVACHLLKWCHHRQDCEGIDVELRFFRDFDLREVDFVILEDQRPTYFIECKKDYRTSNKALKYLKSRFPETKATQIVLQGKEDYVDKYGIRHQPAATFLSGLV